MKLHDTVGAILHRKGSQIWSISPEAMVFDAIKRMAEKNVGALLVIDPVGLPVGIISERDYTRKVILKGRSSKDTPVRQIMTTNLVTTNPEATVNECMSLMTVKRIRHLPVLKGNALVGLLSIGDLVKWIIAAQDVTIEQLENYIVGAYPA